jgi:GNAT superfamily N-acetyltransferase
MPPEAGIIRPFESQDADACCGLVCACLRTDPGLPPAAREALLLVESPAIMRERAQLFYVAVCVLGDSIAGTGGVDMNEIRFLFVDPAHQRRGVGTYLLRHLETFVPPALFADVYVYSTPTAEGFYRKHGYQPGGQHVYIVSGTDAPVIFMTKKLRP